MLLLPRLCRTGSQCKRSAADGSGRRARVNFVLEGFGLLFFWARGPRDRGPFDSIVEVRSLDSFGVWVEDSFPLLPFLKFFPLCFADALADVIFAGFVCNVS
jgi:hypothetical protein